MATAILSLPVLAARALSPAILSLTVLALPVVSRAAHAQNAGDVDTGRRIADTWCINCHVVSPTQPQGTSNGAPPFTAIAAQKAITPMALRVFLQTPHHRMPDLDLRQDEIDDVSAYIFSLRRPSG